MNNEKNKLKKIKKRAELARKSAGTNVGERFPDTYDWGEDLLESVLQMELRLMEIERRLKHANIENIRNIPSDAFIVITTTKTISSSAHIKAETTQTVDSDAEVEE